MPYRDPPATNSRLATADYQALNEYAGRVRRALAFGTLVNEKRSTIAEMAAELEETHARLSRLNAVTTAIITTIVAILGALAALARGLPGAMGAAVPVILIMLSGMFGFSLMIAAGNRETLARVKDTIADLMRFAATLPADEAPTRVRVEAQELTGTMPVEVAFSSAEQEEKTSMTLNTITRIRWFGAAVVVGVAAVVWSLRNTPGVNHGIVRDMLLGCLVAVMLMLPFDQWLLTPPRNGR